MPSISLTPIYYDPIPSFAEFRVSETISFQFHADGMKFLKETERPDKYDFLQVSIIRWLDNHGKLFIFSKYCAMLLLKQKPTFWTKVLPSIFE